MNIIVCPHCQASNRPGANFCATCGHDLGLLSSALEELPTMPVAAPSREADPLEDAQTVPIAKSLDLRVGRRTHTGRRRSSNEDSLLALNLLWSNKSIDQPAGLFVVADGMGGHDGGEIASGMLVRCVARRAADWLPGLVAGDEPIDHGRWLIDALQEANREIYAWARDAGYEMGTTVAAALVAGDQAYIAHVGDSRVYRANADAIERLTVDHSLVESLVVANQISREEARDHPQSNVIYRTIGDQADVAVDMKQVQLAPGELLLLCSDGLSGMVADEVIHRALIGAASPQAACDALIDAANRAGGEDNITAIVIALASPDRPRID